MNGHGLPDQISDTAFFRRTLGPLTTNNQLSVEYLIRFSRFDDQPYAIQDLPYPFRGQCSDIVAQL